MKVDLHIHTAYSDGVYTPEKIVETAINEEIPQVHRFDNIIVNDDVSVAGAELLAIIKAEKLKYKRNQEIINELGLKGENK